MVRTVLVGAGNAGQSGANVGGVDPYLLQYRSNDDYLQITFYTSSSSDIKIDLRAA